jgi:hypothetical protein
LNNFLNLKKGEFLMSNILEKMKEVESKFENHKILIHQKQQEINELYKQMYLFQGEYQALQSLANEDGLIEKQDFNKDFVEIKPTSI